MISKEQLEGYYTERFPGKVFEDSEEEEKDYHDEARDEALQDTYQKN